jgi:hypothetical protein
VDHLAKAGLNINGMEVGLVSVDKKGSEADATVSITPKGGNPAQGMSMKYHLEERGGAWVVTGRQDAGAAHGGAVMPEAGNPHATPAPGGKMPSPEDLPPAKK